MTKLVTCDTQVSSLAAALNSASPADKAALAAAIAAAGIGGGTGGSPTGAAGGGLAGTYPNPTINPTALAALLATMTYGNTGTNNGSPAKVLPAQYITKSDFSQVTTSGFVTSPATGPTPTVVTYSTVAGTASYSEAAASDSFGTWNAAKTTFTFTKACIVDISCAVDLVVSVDTAGTSGNAADQNHVSMSAYLTVGLVAANAGFLNVDTTTTGYVGAAASASYPNLRVAVGDTVSLTVRSSGASGTAAVRFFAGNPGGLTQSGGDLFQGILIARRA